MGITCQNLQHSVLNGLQLNGLEPVGAACEGCQLGKGHRGEHRSSPSRAQRPFELVHADLFGPVGISTPKGGRYGSIFKDDYSGALFVAILARKSDVVENLKDIISSAKHLGYDMKELRTDNDSVYCSTQAKQLYRASSVHHSTSIPYTPQQNGAAERAVRTISETANALMQQAKVDRLASGLPAEYWGQAVLTAAYVRNRSWHKGKDKTPIEMLTGRRPSHLRVFGSSAFTHIPRQLRQGESEPHRQRAMFVGYPSSQSGWLFLDETTKKIFTATHAAILKHQSLSQAKAKHLEQWELLSHLKKISQMMRGI